MISALPLPVALALGRAFAWMWHYCLPVRRGVARRNVRRVFPELSRRERHQLVRQSFNNLGMYGIETLRLPSLTPQQAEALVHRPPEYERLVELLGQGKGLIVATAHFGNWDLFGCSEAIRGLPLNVIVKDIGWKAGHDFVFAVRHRCRFQTIAPRRSADLIRAALGRNEVVAIISDQHMPPHRGVVGRFFGELVSTSPAVARFAYDTGAPILPIICVRDRDDPARHRIVVEPELKLESPHASREANLRHNTERLNRVVEDWVRKYPEQWLWLHKRWKVQDNPEGWSIPQELLGQRDA